MFHRYIACGFSGCGRRARTWKPVNCQTWGPADLACCEIHAGADVTHCPCNLCTLARKAMAPWN